ncbi:MAG: ABC transporter ATP-binding protein [Oscillospiraceae bacterium]|nr:ABC transporter ATP-binding protein [Oscillospiraceae bacterium]
MQYKNYDVSHNPGGDEPLLTIRNLRTSFFTGAGEIAAVRGVSLTVRRGECLGVVGESGSGKSVTFLSALRLLAPAGRVMGGEIRFQGRDLLNMRLKEMREVRGARIAMIFQDPLSSLNPLIPIGKQVDEMLWAHEKNLTARQRKDKTLELLTKAHIPEAERRYGSYPHEFSGGMRQRVMIAMALACKPDLLVADEPTTALDVSIQNQILRLIKSLQSEMGMGVAFITHDLGVIAQMCTRVSVLYGGLVMEDAAADDLFDRPLHPYTEGLLTSMPSLMQDRSIRLSPIPGSPPDMSAPPSGCPFAPRCAHARNICVSQMPPTYTYADGRQSRCWLHSHDAPAFDNPYRDIRGTAVPDEEAL